jgi:uncharacterized protein YifE (UPF0438 family)
MSEDQSWQLTPEVAVLIEQYLDFYRALDSGRRHPSTETQRHFVAVCRCAAKAQSAHEIAYLKYRMLRLQHAEPLRDAHAVDDLGEGVPQPGWFTDEGWKRMRGQYRSNSD